MLAEVCRTELSEISMRAYWDFFESRCTIDEWEAACEITLEREKFHAVPMPAVLLEYATEIRRQWWKEAEEERKREEWQIAAEQRRIAAEKQALLEATPEWQEEQRLSRERFLLWTKELEEKKAQELLKPIPVFTPIDPIARRAELRRQIQQIMTEENEHQETIDNSALSNTAVENVHP